MTNKSEPEPEPIMLPPSLDPPWLPDPEKLENLKFEMSSMPASTNFYAEPAHVMLSRFVYDLARRIENRNMRDDCGTDESDFLEELIAMIGKAPLSSEYAMKLAFAPPAKPTGTGPHKLVAKNGETARCGGPGLCRWCTEGEPN